MMTIKKDLKMQYSQDVRKIVMPIAIIWLALSASLLVYGGVLFYMGKTSMIDINGAGNLKTILIPMSYLPFLVTFIFYKKKDAIIRSGNMDRSPYAQGLNDQDKNTLKYYGSYFVVHVIMWAINESGAILGFVLTFVTGNFSYYLYPAIIALFLNLVVMKPNYYHFIQGKKLE